MHHPKRNRALTIVALVLLALAAAVPRDSALSWRAMPVALSGLLLVVTLIRRGPALVALLVCALATLALTGLPWQAVMLGALLLVLLAARLHAGFDRARVPLGTVPLAFTFVCAAVTPVALIGWVWLLEPDLTPITSAIPRASLALLLLGGAVFALVNATLEEWIWRGLLQTELCSLFGVSAAVAIQALSFGSVHAHGFPSGAIGVALAATWALMLGVLRTRSGGVLAPIAAHVVADATIAAIVISRLG
jgi:uncharacterized protein